MSRCPFIVEYQASVFRGEVSLIKSRLSVECGAVGPAIMGRASFPARLYLVPARARRWRAESAQVRHGSRQNVLAEMLEKVLAYNISQIIPARKKLEDGLP
jgi:hypothetical protein